VTESEADFGEAVVRTMQSGPPSQGDDLLGMEIDFEVYLEKLTEIDGSSISVTRTAHPESLIVAECSAAEGVALPEAAQAVRRAWLGPLRYDFHEAHHVTVSDNQAVLRFITQMGPADLFVTGQVTVHVTRERWVPQSADPASSGATRRRRRSSVPRRTLQ
jgi:hypothetical protein